MFNEELIAAKVASRNAGKILMDFFLADNQEIEFKGINNPVTIADKKADKYLYKFLSGEFPDDGWLSEETVDTEERLSKDKVWIVDPLDGTKEFIEGVPHFSVSIALVKNGEPVVGVIYNPAKNEMFSCQKGKGVYFNGSKMKISSKKLLSESSIIVSRSEIKRNEWEPYKNKFKAINPVGSVAYKLALVSAGKHDIFATVAPKNEWDICAGNCIVNEAGGKLIDLNGNQRIYNLENTLIADTIIATNSTLFQEVSDLLF